MGQQPDFLKHCLGVPALASVRFKVHAQLHKKSWNLKFDLDSQKNQLNKNSCRVYPCGEKFATKMATSAAASVQKKRPKLAHSRKPVHIEVCMNQTCSLPKVRSSPLTKPDSSPFRDCFFLNFWLQLQIHKLVASFLQQHKGDFQTSKLDISNNPALCEVLNYVVRNGNGDLRMSWICGVGLPSSQPTNRLSLLLFAVGPS